VTAGDVTSDSAVVWARSDRIARMHVEWATDKEFRNLSRMPYRDVTARTGYTGQTVLKDLPPGKDIYYRVRFDSGDGLTAGETATGHLRTAAPGRNVSFVFGGDQCGAGWGINPKWGGLRLFKTMRETNPDFLIHLGDRIYADRPLNEIVRLGDDKVWNNIVTPAKQKVAETLAEFHGNYSYNFLDEHYRRFSAEVPMIATWDDHEVTNNWWPGLRLSFQRMQRKGYTTRSVNALAKNGTQAFLDFTPMRRHEADPNRIYRKISYGPLVDVFILDGRSYRTPNDSNALSADEDPVALLGPAQTEWLKESLVRSRAVWKVIGNPLPIAHAPRKKKKRHDKWANSDHGIPLGRERELAGILSHIKRNGVRNVVWLAADVHYSAAHFFDPGRGSFQDFSPFWEFISGPFHTRPGRVRHLDRTFGPQRFFRSPLSPKKNTPPSDGYQYFGHATVDAKSGRMTVSIRDLTNTILYSKSIDPDR
jgi:alkaline phosphatase D